MDELNLQVFLRRGSDSSDLSARHQRRAFTASTNIGFSWQGIENDQMLAGSHLAEEFLWNPAILWHTTLQVNANL